MFGRARRRRTNRKLQKISSPRWADMDIGGRAAEAMCWENHPVQTRRSGSVAGWAEIARGPTRQAEHRTARSQTQHTCGGPVFGRLTPGCPRCRELRAGAPKRS